MHVSVARPLPPRAREAGASRELGRRPSFENGTFDIECTPRPRPTGADTYGHQVAQARALKNSAIAKSHPFANNTAAAPVATAPPQNTILRRHSSNSNCLLSQIFICLLIHRSRICRGPYRRTERASHKRHISGYATPSGTDFRPEPSIRLRLCGLRRRLQSRRVV